MAVPSKPNELPKSGDSEINSDWIAGRVKVLLSHYFHPDLPQDVEDEGLVDWLDVIGHLPQASIEHACKRYLQNQPRKRPAPGDILRLAQAHVKAQTPDRLEGYQSVPIGQLPKPEPTEEERDQLAESAQRILESAGFTKDRMDLINRFPKAQTFSEAEEMAEAKKVREPHWSKTAADDDPRWAALKKARAENEMIQEARKDAGLVW